MTTVPIADTNEPWAQNPAPENHTFQALVRGREAEFPILAAAAAQSVPAHNLTIEWTAEGKSVQNYQQIVRWPYDARPVEEGSDREADDRSKEDALTKFLDAVESVLRDGVPYVSRTATGMPLRSCGGISYYLGRDELIDGDVIQLRPLREPLYRRYEWWMDGDGNWVPLNHIKGEWLAEFSLQVSPA